MKISLFYANAGHGHRKVAEVIAAAFRERGLSSGEIQLADALDWTLPVLRTSYPASYFFAVKKMPKTWGWFYETLDFAPVYKWFGPLRSLWNTFSGSRLLREILKNPPDAIICTHFFAAELFATAKRKGLIKSLIVTVITDFFPHTFWVNPGTDLYWVMGKEGKRELERRGVPEDRILPGGIPVDKQFQPTGRRAAIREKYDLATDRLTLLLTSGSFGLGPQEAILAELEKFRDRVQCLVVAGQNQDLKKRLEAKTFGFPVRVFGFVDFMADLMEASDLIVAKSGGSTTTESLTKGVPMIILEPIPGQETRNANLLVDRGAAFIMQQPSQIAPIVRTILENPGILESKRQEILKLAKPHAAEDLVSFILQRLTRK